MPRILPKPDITKYEYVNVQALGKAGPSQGHIVRVLRKKPVP